MQHKTITSETEYNTALKRLDEVFDSEIGTKESDEANILAELIHNYELIHYPIN
jgi:HTH-type transcriptional regulator / antitoxin HigA